MRYRTLGRTGLEVSEVGHGLWGMGGWTGSSDESSLEALRMSVGNGCNFFDTAWAYGDGHSDQLAGRLLLESQAIVASKVPPANMVFPASPTDAFSDVFPREYVRLTAEKIRGALGVQTIPVLQFHVWDDSWASDPAFGSIVDELKTSGMVDFVGISLNRWEPWNGVAAVKSGLVDTVQVIYNIFDQAPEDELFPACREHGVGIIARVPLDEGSLGGTFTPDTTFPPDDWRAKYFGPENLPPTLERVAEIKSILPQGMTLPEMALRFILSNTDVSTVIVGMRGTSHVVENLAVSDAGPLPSELVAELRKHRWDREVTPWAN